MIILHSIHKDTWQQVKDATYYAAASLETEGFIHCSEVETLGRIAFLFEAVKESLLIMGIDTEKLEAEVKWETGDDSGILYPHVYGHINLGAVVGVVPYQTDEQGRWVEDSVQPLLNQ